EGWKAIFNGPQGPQGVISGIDDSPEAIGQVVRQWYEHFLGREPEAAGQSFWTNLIRSGLSEEQALAAILNSQEFMDRAGRMEPSGTPEERFVQALYNLALNRDAEPGAVSFWTNALRNSSRGAVAAAILGSQEFRGDVIRDLYQALLDRDADDAGLHGWAGSGLHLGQIRRAFLQSQEFFDDEMPAATAVT